MSIVTDNQFLAKIIGFITSNGNNDITGDHLNELLQDVKDSKAHINHSHTKDQVGLGNADNTADINKEVSIPQAAVLVNKADLIGGKLDPAQLPNLSITEFLGEVANQSEMINSVGERGDWVIRSDDGLKYVLIADDYSDPISWKDMPSGQDLVASVNGQTGNVVLTKAFIDLGNVDNTSDANKEVSGPQKIEFDKKLDKPLAVSSTQSGAVSLDLDTFTNMDLLASGDITSLSITGGTKDQQAYVNITKSTDNTAFDIAPDYQEIPYLTGVTVGVATTQAFGRTFHKCNTEIITGKPFDATEWDLDIKLQNDSPPILSYLENEIDQIIITPLIRNSVMYYSLTIIHNVAEK